MPQMALVAVGSIVTKGIGMLATPLVAKLGEGAAIALVTNVLKVGAFTALSVAANALFTPQVGATGSPSEWTADGTAGVPFVIGRMGVSGNIVYRKEFGNDNRYQSIVTVYSGAGPIDGWETFTADGVALNFGANGVATNGGNLANNFWMNRRLGAQPDTALTQPSGLDNGATLPGWGSNHILSGFACSMITLRQDSKFATYPAGEPQPMQVLRGIRVYDPRQDSTYPGGSGSQRLGNRSTWGYTTNPIIHALNWALGYRHNGKLVGGIGADFNSLDVEAFIACANVADANGWTCAGRFSSLDDKHNVLVAMLQAGGAMYSERAGRISCVTRGAPRTSIATVTVADTAGPVEITSATPLRNRLNTVYPRCIQESFGWETTQLQPVIVSDFVDADGGQREREIEYPFVTNSVQAGQLAAFDIVDSREGIAGVIPLKPYMRELRPGDAFTITEPGFLLDGQKCLVLDTAYDPGSDIVRVTFRAETDQKYPFALGLDPTPPSPPALTPGSPYIAPTPDPSEWVVVGGDQTAGDGSKKPVIIIGGDLDAANIQAVWIEYRETGVTEWTTWGIFHPEAVDYTITGVKPNTAYEVSVRYQNAFGVWGERIILGPFTTGGEVASEAIAARAAALGSELADDLSTLDGRIDDVIQTVTDIEGEFQEGVTAVNQAVLSTRTVARDLFYSDFATGNPNPYLTSSATTITTAQPDNASDLSPAGGGVLTFVAADAVYGPSWRIAGGTRWIAFKGLADVPSGSIFEVEYVFRVVSGTATIAAAARRFLPDGTNQGISSASSQVYSTGQHTVTRRFGRDVAGALVDVAINQADYSRARFGLNIDAGSGDVVLGAIRLRDVSGRVLSQASATAAEIARVDAVGAKEDAEGAAAAAGTSQSLAATAASNAGASATASATSATAAQASATAAGEFSARAEQVSVLRAVAGEVGGPLWLAQIPGVPRFQFFGSNSPFGTEPFGAPGDKPDLGSAWVDVAPSAARKGGVRNNTINSRLIVEAPIPVRPGYKVCIEIQYVNDTQVADAFDVRVALMDGSFASLGLYAAPTIQTPSNLGGVQTRRLEYVIPSTLDINWARPYVQKLIASHNLNVISFRAWAQEAAVQTLAGAYLDANGNAVARLEQAVAAAGSNPAYLRLLSGNGLSNAAIIGDEVLLANFDTDGVTVKPVITVIGGVAYATDLVVQNLVANSVTLDKLANESRTQGPAVTTSIIGSGALPTSFTTVGEVNLNSVPGSGVFIADGRFTTAERTEVAPFAPATVEVRVVVVNSSNQTFVIGTDSATQPYSAIPGAVGDPDTYIGGSVAIPLNMSAPQPGNMTGNLTIRVEARRSSGVGQVSRFSVRLGFRRQP